MQDQQHLQGFFDLASAIFFPVAHFQEFTQFWSNLQNFIQLCFLQNVILREEYMQNSSVILMHILVIISDIYLIQHSDQIGNSVCHINQSIVQIKKAKN